MKDFLISGIRISTYIIGKNAESRISLCNGDLVEGLYWDKPIGPFKLLFFIFPIKYDTYFRPIKLEIFRDDSSLNTIVPNDKEIILFVQTLSG